MISRCVAADSEGWPIWIPKNLGVFNPCVSVSGRPEPFVTGFSVRADDKLDCSILLDLWGRSDVSLEIVTMEPGFLRMDRCQCRAGVENV